MKDVRYRGVHNHMIQSLWNSKKCKFIVAEIRPVSQGLGIGRRLTTQEPRETLWSHGDILNLDCSSGDTVYICWNHRHTPERVNFIVTINQTKKANENLGFGFSVKEKLKLKTFQFLQFTVLWLYIVRNYKHKKHFNIRKYLFTVQM